MPAGDEEDITCTYGSFVNSSASFLPADIQGIPPSLSSSMNPVWDSSGLASMTYHISLLAQAWCLSDARPVVRMNLN
jgi:hypothetical protein